jgi:hypothetical protein
MVAVLAAILAIGADVAEANDLYKGKLSDGDRLRELLN